MLTLKPIRTQTMSSKFDAGALVVKLLGKSLRDGDVLVISSKFLAVSEGRVVLLSAVRPGGRARKLARIYGMDERFCEVVLQEADQVIGGMPGFMLTIKDGLAIPNAGVDRSNVRAGRAVLYPRRPDLTAKKIRELLKTKLGAAVGVVVCDSRLYPTRRGTTGVAIASSGLEAVVDMRGRKDLFGNTLKVTFQAVADDLCSAAELLMGESDGRVPIVLVRGLPKKLLRRAEYPPTKFVIPPEEDVYLRSFGYIPKSRRV